MMDFIKTKGSMGPNLETSVVIPPTCTPYASLGSVIDSFDVAKRIHRIYVVEGDGYESSVVGVITLRDVISCFVSEPPGYFDDYFGAGVMGEALNK